MKTLLFAVALVTMLLVACSGAVDPDDASTDGNADSAAETSARVCFVPALDASFASDCIFGVACDVDGSNGFCMPGTQ